MTSADILLIGYGPTSATLANLLAPLGWEIDIFDQGAEIYELPRAVFFDDEVMRTLQQIGVAHQALECSQPVQGMELLNQDNKSLAKYEAPNSLGPLGWHAGYMFHQPTLEKILRQKLTHYPNVKVHLGHRVTQVHSKDHRAWVGVTGPNGSQLYSGKFLVGCCGARSITREALNIPLQDFKGDQQWIVIDIELLNDPVLPNTTIQYCNPDRPSTYIPTPGKLRRFELMLMPGESANEISAPEKINELLSKWLDPQDYRIIRSAVYEFHALVAEKWRSGPIFLAGDAAHQMPPFLGQGMCSGIKDAANLYWKLDWVMRGYANEKLLDTYEQERKPFVTQVIESDLWLSRLIQTTDIEVAKQRDHFFFNAPPSERQLTPPIISLGGFPKTTNQINGLPFPQPITEKNILHDSMLGKHLTIVGDIELSNVAKKLIEIGLIKHIQEPHQTIAQWLKQHQTQAVLVRPDKYVLQSAVDKVVFDETLNSLGLLHTAN